MKARKSSLALASVIAIAASGAVAPTASSDNDGTPECGKAYPYALTASTYGEPGYLEGPERQRVRLLEPQERAVLRRPLEERPPGDLRCGRATAGRPGPIQGATT